MQAAHSLLKRAIMQSASKASGTPVLRIRTRRVTCERDDKSPVVSPALPPTGMGGARKRSLSERDVGSPTPQQATKVACSTPLRIRRKVCRDSHSLCAKLCASFPKDCVPLSVCGWVSMNLKFECSHSKKGARLVKPWTDINPLPGWDDISCHSCDPWSLQRYLPSTLIQGALNSSTKLPTYVRINVESTQAEETRDLSYSWIHFHCLPSRSHV
jgi:hypothetical protein